MSLDVKPWSYQLYCPSEGTGDPQNRRWGEARLKNMETSQ